MKSKHNQVKPKKIKITGKKALKLVGCVYYGDPFHSSQEWTIKNEIGMLWNRFFTLYSKYENIMQKEVINDRVYEIHIQPDDYSETGKFYVYVGMEAVHMDSMPVEMFCKGLPSTKYMVFTFKGEDMYHGSEYIYKDWFPNSDYDETYPYMILAYDKARFKGMDDPESEVDFYVPVKKSSE